MNNEDAKSQRLAQAHALLEHIERGNLEAADQLLDELTRMRESELFRQIGQLTRDLHDAIQSFQLDTRLTAFAEKDIPDARERLIHVVEMTEQSAHRTLAAVEGSIRMAERMEGEAKAFGERLSGRVPDDVTRLVADMGAYVNDVARDSRNLREKLSDVLIAQEFQDLTGQTIRKVIGLVQEVEHDLVELVRLSGGVAQVTAQPAGRSSSGAVQGQNEVDDLLKSLGF